MPGANFESSVFINCPFDEGFEPILQAILFCVIHLGFTPRLASENADGAQVRLGKIVELIRASRYSIHDISRSQAAKKGEHYRLNMPFELGIDFGCRTYGGDPYDSKKLLVLAERRYAYMASISDIAGCDIEAHAAKFEKAISKVRNWLVNEANAEGVGTSRIIQKYADFQEWYWKRQLAAGSSEEDIREYPTSEVLTAMQLWHADGEPLPE